MSQFTSNTKEQPNLDPGALLTGEGHRFLMSSEDWIRVQTLIENGLSLPTNKEQMRKSLGLKDPNADVSQFNSAIEAYSTLHNHCLTWKGETYPRSVNLVNDIVHYSTKVSTYYDPLSLAVKEYKQSPTDQLKQRINGIIASLAKDAKTYADRAAQVEADILKFESDISSDRTTISNVRDDYEKKFGQTSEEVEKLKKDLETQKKILDEANEEYNQDVIVASTTPAYLFLPIIPILGWIAAPIVAGVFGDRAVKALQSAKAAQEQINTIGGQIARDANLMSLIHSANNGVHKILESINSALPIIQKIKGAWSAIHNDLEYLQKIIQDDIKEADIVLIDIGIAEAKNQWIKLGQEADDYRVHAYVNFEESNAA